jgi:hypothetical protein
MKPSDIRVGVTYVNRGKGTTRRKVLAIGGEYMRWYGSPLTQPKGPGVLFVQECALTKPMQNTLSLASFARWAGHAVEVD